MPALRSTLLASAHPGPAAAVTALTALLAVGERVPPVRRAALVGAVAAGQLSIGWSNDLLDAGRDAAVGRTDKPLATGRLSRRTVRRACGASLAASVGLSALLGPAGAVQLAHVASGWAYNLGLKSTPASAAPYAVAFGALPVAASLAAGHGVAPWWAVTTGSLLGVGAHLLNALPDLADDAATGVRGLPHRLGPRAAPPVALGVLVTATGVLAVGAGWPAPAGAALVLAASAAAGAGLVTGGRSAFRAAVAVALLDVVAWVASR